MQETTKSKQLKINQLVVVQNQQLDALTKLVNLQDDQVATLINDVIPNLQKQISNINERINNAADIFLKG